ncbi:MAG TPA: prepilin peptidase [Candidatus Saccharimonadales bacterium]|nr:prepilin peptidase [Candidatus Saccharimonadales bacterium]
MYLFPTWTFFLFILFLWPWSFILRIIAHKLIYGLSYPIPSAVIEKKTPCSYFIDILTIICFLLLWTQNSPYFPAYFLFFSALIITIHTDMQHMLISRFVSLYCVPVGIYLSYVHYLPISPAHSILAALGGYCFLLIINTIFYLIKKHDGLGQGDLELLAFIGSFTGLLGCWFSILFGSVLGTFTGCLYILCSRKTVTMLPFGPFLAIGAILFVLFEPWILTFLS